MSNTYIKSGHGYWRIDKHPRGGDFRRAPEGGQPCIVKYDSTSHPGEVVVELLPSGALATVKKEYIETWTQVTSVCSVPGAFAVTLHSSDNQFINHPATGRIQIIECFLNGEVSAVFQQGKYEGCKFLHEGGFVVVRNPKFTH